MTCEDVIGRSCDLRRGAAAHGDEPHPRDDTAGRFTPPRWGTGTGWAKQLAESSRDGKADT